MKRALVTLIFICLTFALNAQVSLSYRLGYGTYRMRSLSDFQQYLLEESGFPAKIVDQFPGYVNHRFYLGIPKNWLSYKVYLGYLTTGGRISLTDYSGKWMIDMKLNGIQGGFQLDIPIQQFNKFDFNGYLDIGITSSFMRIQERMKIGEESSKESYYFVGNGIDFQPGISLAYILSKLNLGCYLGYEAGFSAAFHEKGNSEMKIGTSSGNLAKPDWAGLRTGIQVKYVFGKVN